MNFLYSQQREVKIEAVDPAGQKVQKVLAMYKQCPDSEQYPYDQHENRVEALTTILGEKQSQAANAQTIETEIVRAEAANLNRELSAVDFDVLMSSDGASATGNTQLVQTGYRARSNMEVG